MWPFWSQVFFLFFFFDKLVFRKFLSSHSFSGVVNAEHSTQFCYEVLKAIRELPDLLTDELIEATKVKVKKKSLNLDFVFTSNSFRLKLIH